MGRVSLMQNLQGFLGKIYPMVQARIVEVQKKVTLEEMKTCASARILPLIDVKERMVKRRTPVVVIAEIKRASPSTPPHQKFWCRGKGAISDRNIFSQVQEYVDGGAVAISVLTEPSYFKGSIDDLARLKESFPYIPFLRKDFIISEYQVYESKAAGADMLLLITRWLEGEELRRLYQLTRAVGLHALVEVETEEDLTRACAIGAEIIGINARNLTDLTVDVNRVMRLVRTVGARLVAPVHGRPIVVGESGIDSVETVHEWHEAGVNVILVGGALMKAGDPAGLVRTFSLVE